MKKQLSKKHWVLLDELLILSPLSSRILLIKQIGRNPGKGVGSKQNDGSKEWAIKPHKLYFDNPLSRIYPTYNPNTGLAIWGHLLSTLLRM